MATTPQFPDAGWAGVIVTIGLACVAGLAWLFGLHGLVQAQKATIEDNRKRIEMLEGQVKSFAALPQAISAAIESMGEKIAHAQEVTALSMQNLADRFEGHRERTEEQFADLKQLVTPTRPRARSTVKKA